jgi:rhodanese-related sulfurtransferase/DNA-binding HxlR family transcriptional regulator
MTNTPRQIKANIFEQLARIGKALSSGPRLEILDVLSHGPRRVEVLADQIGQSTTNTSHHLQVLRRARLVDSEKEGVRVIYRLSDQKVEKLFRDLCELGDDCLLELQALTRNFVEDRRELQRVDAGKLVERLERGEVTLLDVRPAEEYDSIHIPGAISIPMAELEQRIEELPQDKEIVAYCRGPYCFLAVEAVKLLDEQGLSAAYLARGVTEWRGRKLPVEQHQSQF